MKTRVVWEIKRFDVDEGSICLFLSRIEVRERDEIKRFTSKLHSFSAEV